jgi:hypothetical protein
LFTQYTETGNKHMRLTITWLLVIMIASMLVGTALAECAAMAMPCCSQHRSTNCHEICATPAANISNATTPSPAEQEHSGALSVFLLSQHVLDVQPEFHFAPSSNNLLIRIHLLLI